MKRPPPSCWGWALGAALLIGCGQSHGPGSTSASSETGSLGTSITGNVASGIGAHDPSVLVFVLNISDDNPTPNSPVGVGMVGKDGSFAVTDLPAGRLSLIFLRDDANDGAMDPQDVRARYSDKAGDLRLEDGDRAELVDVQIDFASGKAVSTSVNVARNGGEPTPTPEAGANAP